MARGHHNRGGGAEGEAHRVEPPTELHDRRLVLVREGVRAVPVVAQALGDHPLSQIDGVKPGVLVRSRPKFLCIHSVRVAEPQQAGRRRGRCTGGRPGRERSGETYRDGYAPPGPAAGDSSSGQLATR